MIGVEVWLEVLSSDRRWGCLGLVARRVFRSEEKGVR